MLAGAASAPAATPLQATALQTISSRDAGSDPTRAVTAGGIGFFSAYDGEDHGEELWSTDGTSAPRLVKDIAPGGESATPDNLTAMGGDVYFTAADGTHGRELWVSDGTAAGTSLVSDIRPGTQSSNIQQLVASGGKLYFSADDGTGTGQQLWTSDGTAAGTHMVKAINSSGSTPISWLVPFDGGVAMSADDGTQTELWVSDGTLSGTTRVDVATGAASSDPAYLTAIGSELYFAADDGTGSNVELFKSDGSTASLVKDVDGSPTTSSDPETLTAVGSTLYFVAGDSTGSNRELWSSNGTGAGTARVKDINGNGTDSDVENLTALGATLYFTADDGSAGDELYRSDGTLAGTAIVKDIDTTHPGDGSYPNELTVVGSHLDFTADSGDGTGTRLWTTDGTAAGTSEIPGGQGDANSLAAIGSHLSFVDNDNIHGNEPGISDGTAAGTRMYDINTTGQTEPGAAVALGDLRLFTAATDTGRRVFVTDGTAGGTHALAVTGTGGTREIAVLGGKAYFFGQTSDGYDALFATDGTDAGTTEVKRVSLAGDEMTVVGGLLYFSGTTGFNNEEPWASDGTTAGTGQIKDINVGGSSHPADFTALGSKVLFRGYTGTGWRLYATDGTSAGTDAVSATLDASGSSGEAVLDGKLYFTGSDGTYGRELWATDGTDAGTTRVTDLDAGTGNASPQGLTVAGGTLYFDADNGSGSQLYAYDGTGAPTALGAGDDYDLTPYGGGLLFAAGPTSELTVTDGTVAGTHGLGATVPDQGPIAVIGTTAYFMGADAEHGAELWSTDGTAAGTGLAADIAAGTPSSRAVPLTQVGGELLTLADQPGTGTVLARMHVFTPDDGGTQSGGGTTTTTTTTATTRTPTTTTTTTTTRPAPPKGRATARGLSLTVSRSAGRRPPFRIAVSGKLTPAAGLAARTACAGTVTITARRGDVKVVSVRVKLRPDCSYRATLTKNTIKHLAAHGGRLAIAARFSGNAALLPARSATRTSRYGA